MPHDKAHLSSRISDSSGVAVDHRRALTLTPITRGKHNTCRIGNPLKFSRRRNLAKEYADEDVIKSAKKPHKIHWTQLAGIESSSQPAFCHNGRKAHDHDEDNNGVKKENIMSRQVKVILTDVLKTEVGRNYLRKCGKAPTPISRSELKNQAREELNITRLSADHGDRWRTCAARRGRTKLLPLTPTNKRTGAENSEDTDADLSEEIKPSPAKRLKTAKLTTPTTSVTNDPSSPIRTDHSPCKQSPNILSNQKSPNPMGNESLNPARENPSPRSSSGSPVHSVGTEPEISERIITATPSRVTRSERRSRMEYHSPECKTTPPRHSESQMQECAEEMRDEGQEEVSPPQNGEVLADADARCSVPRLSDGATEDRGLELVSEDPEVQSSPGEPCISSEHADVTEACTSDTSELIVLSSEEEELEDNTHPTPEGAKYPFSQPKSSQTGNRKKTFDIAEPLEMIVQNSDPFEDFSDCPDMELRFSALYMGGFSALSGGLLKIASDCIIISLEGTEAQTSVPTEHVCKYSVWDEHLVQNIGLVKGNEVPPSSLLLLWLAEAQARRVSNDLSAQQPETGPVEALSKCRKAELLEVAGFYDVAIPRAARKAEIKEVVLAKLREDQRLPVSPDSANIFGTLPAMLPQGVQGAILASIMDIVGIGHNNTSLLSPLSHEDTLKVLQDSRDTHLLQLLRPRAETPAVEQESRTSPEAAASSTAKAQESDPHPDLVYTLSHSRTQQGHYIVSLAHKPSADWTPYKHCAPARRLIQFPPPPSKGAITVTTEDLECLDSGQFLNDVIIDFYLKYLLVQKAPRESVKRSHVFSSFFYKQLTRRDNANEDVSSTPQFRRHQRVRTWTRHVDIFEKDFLFVPVNQEAHWYLVVVCFPGLEEPQNVDQNDQERKVHDGTEDSCNPTSPSESQEGGGEKNLNENNSRTPSGSPTCTFKTCKQQTVCKRPCILIMDSLKLSVHERIIKLLRDYLQVEWEVKRGGFRDFSAEQMEGSHCKVPLQNNSSDCGLYLLQYAESFLQDPVVHFDLPLRLENWFPRQKVREKREEIRDLILSLYRFQQDSPTNEVSQQSPATENSVH